MQAKTSLGRWQRGLLHGYEWRVWEGGKGLLLEERNGLMAIATDIEPWADGWWTHRPWTSHVFCLCGSCPTAYLILAFRNGRRIWISCGLLTQGANNTYRVIDVLC